MRRAGRLVSAAMLALLAQGCTIMSDSTRLFSKSTSSLSASSSDEGNPVYMRKIRDYSYGYAKAGGDPEAFVRGIGSLAQRDGVSDWERDEETCRAIGEGFRDARIGESATQRSIGRIVSSDSKCGFWMRAGYHER